MTTHGDNLLAALPLDWSFDRFKDVVLLRNEKTDERSAEEDYLELEDLESGSGRILSRRNTLDVGSAVTHFKKGDVLFGKLRPYLEKYWEAEFDGKCTGEILAFHPKRIAGRSLLYCLASRWFIERCNALAYGAKRPRVSWPTQLAHFNLPLPPLPEQHRIAAYLDASCAAIDAAVAAKRQQLEILEVVRSSIVEGAVTRGLNRHAKHIRIDQDWLGTLPTHWSAMRIKRLVSRVDYGISVRTEPEGKYPVLKMGNIQGGEIVFSKIEFVDDVVDELILKKDDLLYNRTNSPDQVGKAAIFRGCKAEGVTFASYLVRLRTNHRIAPDFLNYAVNCSGFLAFARKLAIPSVQQSNLNSTRYCRMLIPLPPLHEQRAICEYLGIKIGELTRVANSIESQITTLTADRKSLIHECVTGQRRISEADLQKVKTHAGR
jgi:type I restriction enzyme S subunit